MQKAIIHAAMSATAAYGCLVTAVAGFVILPINWHDGLALVLVAIALATAASTFEKLKLQALYGPNMGNILHREGWIDPDPARRDLLAYHRLRRRYHTQANTSLQKESKAKPGTCTHPDYRTGDRI